MQILLWGGKKMGARIFRAAVSTFLAVFLLAVYSSASDEKPDTPTVLKGGKIISAEEAKALLDKKEAKFFDFRSPVNYGKGHVPGAVSLPYKGKSENNSDFDASQDEFDLSKLPADKNAKIVFYSDGPKGWKSYKAAVLAIRAGYKNIMWYRDGSDTWESRGYPFER